MLRSLLVLSLLAAQVSIVMADSIQMTIPARKPGAPNVPELEAYVFQADPYRAGIPPRRLDPAKVGAYLAVMIDRTTPLRAVRSAETVAEFYDASEVVTPYLALLDRTEKTADDRVRSAILARVIATLGAESDVRAAASYFVYLAGLAESQSEIDELVRLFAALPTATDAKPLQDRITARIAVLAPTIATDYQARLESLKLQEDLRADLEGVKRAKIVQAKILAIADRPARLRALLDVYLGIEAISWDLRPWAAARLRRETWAENPPENVRRVAKAAHTKTVIKALRDVLPVIAKQDPEEQPFMKLRALRAIAFFGGTLSAAEKKRAADTTQSDILANEGFMIAPKKR